MAVHIELNGAAISRIKKQCEIAADKAIQKLHTDVDDSQVMPFDTGEMQDNKTFTETTRTADGVCARLITGGPQARRLYHNPQYHFQTGKNPNARGKWLDDYLNGGKKSFLQDAFTENMKEWFAS
jgi:hypothetical protein